MKHRIKRYWLCLLLAIGLLGVLSSAALAEGGLEVHFMDIGRNDGILIRCGGEDVFIDSGSHRRGVAATEYMRELGITHLKYYIGTHAHEDHVQGAPVIIEAFRPDAVLQPHKKVGQVILESVRNQAEREAVRNTEYINVTLGQTYYVGDAVLTCLGPLTIRNIYPKEGPENENSLVLRLTYGEVDILLTGDITNGVLEKIEAAYPGSLKADVLKNPHHNHVMKEAIFAAVDPEYVIFSTSSDCLPEDKTKKILNTYQAKAYVTTPNHSGHVILHTDGKEISFTTQYRTESITPAKSELTLYEGKYDRVGVKLSPSGRAKMLLYESLNPSVATVDYDGRVTAVSQGTTTIRISDATGAVGEYTVHVIPPQIKLRTTEVSVADGSRTSLSWSVEPSGSKAVPVWASMDESIATVDQKGRITGVYPGQTVVTATMPSGKVTEVAVTVTPVAVKSVSIKPSSLTMTIGEHRSVSASVSPSNATWKDVTWSSQNENILTVSADGTVYAVGVGKTKLTATAVGGKSKTINVTVNPVYVKKVVLPQGNMELIVGAAGYESAQITHHIEPLNATIQDVVWSSSNKNIVSVDENGVITAHKQGNAYITCKATDGSGKYAKIRVYVERPTEQVVLNRTTLEVYEGTAATLKASLKPSSSTKKLFFESSDPSVAMVSDSGKITGVRSGTATIRVSDVLGVYAECIVTVKPTQITLTQTTLSVKAGSRVSAAWRTSPSSAKPNIVWTSADESIATVDASGRITGVYPGDTIITATMPGGEKHHISLTVKPIYVTYIGIKPSSLKLTLGESSTLKTSVSPSNATWKDVDWTSADEGIATVNADGLVQAVGIGKTKITATAQGGKSRSITVTVTPIYVKRLIAPEVPKGLVAGVKGRNQVQLTCGIEPANATIQTIAWSSSNKKIATVDQNGLVTGLKAGTVTITFKATDGSGRYGQIKVTFAENELKQSVRRVEGQMVVAPSRIRYRDNGTTLEIEMTYINRTGKTQAVPYRGTLVLIAPDGTTIPLMQVNASQRSLSNRDSRTYTYQIPVSVNPRLIGLDLTQCDAAMMNLIP